MMKTVSCGHTSPVYSSSEPVSGDRPRWRFSGRHPVFRISEWKSVTPTARVVSAVAFLALVAFVSVASEESDPAPLKTPEPKTVEYGKKGLDIRSPDGNFHAHIDWRVQFRFTNSTFDDGSIGQSPEVREGDFVVSRARFKLGGHAYRPWLSYYFEYDFPSSRMLDFRLTAEVTDAFRVRVGQWKIPYNRERVDSSGKQQFVERSIANDPFTVDRQQGVLVFGRLWPGTRADSWFNLGVYSGTGRGGTGSIDQPLVQGRWQWNFFGRDLGFSQSDIGRRQEPAGSLAVATARWAGPYSAFSSAGGGQLPGLAPGDNGRYDVEQAVFETAFQWRGFSWQQEYHWKSVEDTTTSQFTELEGGYLQAGWFPNGAFDWVPRPLEIAGRYARVDRETAGWQDFRQEWVVAGNWFIASHRNKITLDLSRLFHQQAEPGRHWETRVRVQWDVSF